MPQGRGTIEFEYEIERSPIHTIEWMLWFPKVTLTKLAAMAKRAKDKKFSPLNTTKEAKIRWEDSGAL